jgi:ankyrin repeat protein
MRHQIKVAVQTGDIAAFNKIMSENISEEVILIQSITSDDLQTLKHNEEQPSWEFAGYGIGSILPSPDARYRYEWDMDDKYIVRLERRPPLGTHSRMLNLIMQKRASLGFSSELDSEKKYSTPTRRDVHTLYQACKGDFAAAKLIIEIKGVNPNVVFPDGSMLEVAAENGNLDFVKYLIDTHHVDMDVRVSPYGYQDSALSRACNNGHYEVVHYLLTQGANPNSPISGGSVLTNAIESRNFQLVELLVNHGAHIKNKEIHYALKEGVFEISEFLLIKIEDVHLLNSDASPFVQVAAKGGCIKTLKLLIDKYQMNLLETGPILDRNEFKGYGILSAAAKGGSVEMMRFLVEECGLDLVSVVKYENEEENVYKYYAYRTILGRALESKKLPLIKYLAEQLNLLPVPHVLKTLKAKQAWLSGIKVNAYLESHLTEDLDKQKVLLQLAHGGLDSLDLPQLLMLFQSKLPRNDKDFVGSELSEKIKEKVLSVEQIDVLVQKYSTIAKDLLCYFASSCDDSDWMPQINTLLEKGVSINSTNDRGESLLQLAISAKGYSPLVKAFIAKGANVDQPNHNGLTAINMLDDEEAITQALSASLDYTNSLKQAVKEVYDMSLRPILRHSRGAIGTASVAELVESAIGIRGKLVELLCYVSVPVYSEMKSLLTSPDFVSSHKETYPQISRALQESERRRETKTEVQDRGNDESYHMHGFFSRIIKAQRIFNSVLSPGSTGADHLPF